MIYYFFKEDLYGFYLIYRKNFTHSQLLQIFATTVLLHIIKQTYFYNCCLKSLFSKTFFNLCYTSISRKINKFCRFQMIFLLNHLFLLVYINFSSFLQLQRTYAANSFLISKLSPSTWSTIIICGRIPVSFCISLISSNIVLYILFTAAISD